VVVWQVVSDRVNLHAGGFLRAHGRFWGMIAGDDDVDRGQLAHHATAARLNLPPSTARMLRLPRSIAPA